MAKVRRPKGIQEAKEPPPGVRAPKAPNYGSGHEKGAHEKLDPKYHHGGRTQTPNEDVNPAKDLHIDDEPNSRETERKSDPRVH